MRGFILAIALAGVSLTVAQEPPQCQHPRQDAATGLPRRGILKKGQELKPGDWLVTSDGFGNLYGAVLQGDGNFVLYSKYPPTGPGDAWWSSWREWGPDKKVKKIVFSQGGDLLALGEPVGGKDVILWSSYTNKASNKDGRSGHCLVLINDKLRIYSADGKEMWWQPRR
jgi:hypothetical protein